MFKKVNGKRVRLTELEILNRKEEEKKAEASHKATRYITQRLSEYPNIGDQLDAILKQFAMMRLNGVDMNADMDTILGQWLAVKKKYPKPEVTDGKEGK